MFTRRLSSGRASRAPSRVHRSFRNTSTRPSAPSRGNEASQSGSQERARSVQSAAEGGQSGSLQESMKPQNAWQKGKRTVSRLLKRTFRAFIAGIVSTFSSMKGIAGIALLSTALGAFAMGMQQCAGHLLLATAVVMVVYIAIKFVQVEVDDGDGPIAILKMLGGQWKSLGEVFEKFDDLIAQCPQLANNKLVMLQQQAPSELLLRFSGVVAAHGRRGPHPAVVAESQGGEASSSNAVADPREDEKIEKESIDKPASKDQVEELRYWLPLAEGAYFNMTSSDAIEEYLEKWNYQLVSAMVEGAPSWPGHAVAVNEKKKSMLILLRGTMTINDALTDMIAAPEEWQANGHKHQVHSGIAQSADHVFTRLAKVCEVFHKQGYTIHCVGHSLGAGAGAMLAWLLKNRVGLKNVRCVGYAMPPSCTPKMAEELADGTVLSCVFRDDLVPRLTPQAIMRLEEQVEKVSWKELEACSSEWGPQGSLLLTRAKIEHKRRKRNDNNGDGGEGDEEDSKSSQGDDQEDGSGQQILFDPTVPGTVVWLRPKTPEAAGLQAEQASEMKQVPGAEGEEESDFAAGDTEELITCEDFEQVLVKPRSGLMNGVRLCSASVNDHFLDSYRIGLNMPFRPSNAPKGNESGEDSDN